MVSQGQESIVGNVALTLRSLVGRPMAEVDKTAARVAQGAVRRVGEGAARLRRSPSGQ